MRVDLGFVELTVRFKRIGLARPLELRKYEVASSALAPVVHRRLLRQIKRNLRQRSKATA
jgi:hypothetical protein